MTWNDLLRKDAENFFRCLFIVIIALKKPYNEWFINLVHSVITGNVVVQFYPWFNFYFLLFWGMVIYDNEFRTKENKN